MSHMKNVSAFSKQHTNSKKTYELLMSHNLFIVVVTLQNVI